MLIVLATENATIIFCVDTIQILLQYVRNSELHVNW